jgi:hypothetical protein
MVSGATRLALGASDVKSIRAAVISGPNDMFSPTDLAPLLEGKIRDDERAQFRREQGRTRQSFRSRSPVALVNRRKLSLRTDRRPQGSDIE